MRLPAYVPAALLAGAGILATGACANLDNLAGGGSGDGGPATDASLAIALAPASLDFGVAGCGTQVPPQTVALENTGPTPITFEASLPEASGFALGGQQVTTTSGTVPPGGRTVFSINVAALRTLGPLTTKLTIKVGEELREVPITVTGFGPKLDVDRQVLDYGDVYYTATSAADVTLSNPGTEDITIKSLVNLGTDFTVDASTPLPLVVPKGGSAKLKLDFAAGPEGPALTRDVTLETDAKPLCGDKPTLSLLAKRVRTDVTINPGTVDFGKQPCGSSPGPQVVTITNCGPTAASVTVTAAAVSRYSFPKGTIMVPGTTGMTPGTATFPIKPIPVAAPVGVVTESIPLAVNGTARALMVRMEPRGVILDFSPTYVSFFFFGQKRIVTVANSGNENAVTSYSSSSPAFTPGAGDTIFPTVKSNMEITYTPSDPDGLYTGFVTTSLPPGTPLCAVLRRVDVETK